MNHKVIHYPHAYLNANLGNDWELLLDNNISPLLRRIIAKLFIK